MSPSNELKQSKYLPPLTKRSLYFNNKNIKIGDNKETEINSPKINESNILFLILEENFSLIQQKNLMEISD